MVIFPSIYLKDGKCVRLVRGNTATAQVVSEDPVGLAKSFVSQGASFLHIIDVDGAREGRPVNCGIIFDILDNAGAKLEVGGGIRDMDTVKKYLTRGVEHIILGSAAVRDPEFVKEAVRAYGDHIVIAIDAKDGKVADEGWTEQSQLDFIELAKRVEKMGVKNIIFTDISQNGGMDGPNFPLLDNLNQEVSCNIIASGGISSLLDLIALSDLGLYGAVAGSSLYNGALDLHTAIVACRQISKKKSSGLPKEAELCFEKAELVPAVLIGAKTGQVLALKMVNSEAMSRCLETGEVWTYSRSRRSVWKKLTSLGNPMKISSIRTDCGNAAFLLSVDTDDPVCHTGERSCFYKELPFEGK